MSKDSATTVIKSGTPWSYLIGMVFIVLKLTGYIAWSWWIVTLPFYLPLLLFIAFLLIIGVIGLVGLLITLAVLVIAGLTKK